MPVGTGTALSIEPVIGQGPPPHSLSLLPTGTGERSDAARNRQLLLDAAEALVQEQGADGVTMDAVAKRAGVGKGTVFRRFGNRAGLMLALLDQSDQKMQAAYMFGPPPLGPGAPPVERLIAFGRARLAGVELEGDVRKAADAGEQHYSGAPYNVAKTHVSLLLRQSGTPCSVPLLADTLLAALDAGLILHQMRVLGNSLEQLGDHWETLVRQVTDSDAG
ncbi:TetR/AcrR family transcriptional regulator [Nocardia jejuensis]|uniref:TetR/AcrR family transcriptional regulator n=1 Tax=Nocardia jejuensis TaxID=328049 RepID=UPI000A004759|nr:helix-turn-helix domain-containing protein [Nocardia jejuensis]